MSNSIHQQETELNEPLETQKSLNQLADEHELDDGDEDTRL